MWEPRVSDTAALLRLLTGENVEFIVVGMSAAVLQKDLLSSAASAAPRPPR